MRVQAEKHVPAEEDPAENLEKCRFPGASRSNERQDGDRRMKADEAREQKRIHDDDEEEEEGDDDEEDEEDEDDEDDDDEDDDDDDEDDKDDEDDEDEEDDDEDG